ncbi:hypothetical protein [Proteus vulgaris]|uniref:hypothetical protein n=1 Tax=Proteus vulgaris TaxID=585 RepID=UPI0013D01F3B|nr:hypothetical protein [Proteus vulgaris]
MTFQQELIIDCKQSQRKYMSWAKEDKEYPELRKAWLELALMARRHAREWFVMS